MKTDMSPAAVTSRLEMLGELWELGVELMSANPKRQETGALTERILSENCETSDEEGSLNRLSEPPR